MCVCVCVCVRTIQCTVWINTETTTPKLELFYSKLLGNSSRHAIS